MISLNRFTGLYNPKQLIIVPFFFLFLLMGNRAFSQFSVPSPASLLPPLKETFDCIAISQVESKLLSEVVKLNANDQDSKRLLDAYNFIIVNAAMPNPDLPLILANMYPILEITPSGSITQLNDFYAKKWNIAFRAIVSKLKR